MSIRYCFVQKGILSQHGVSSNVLKLLFMSTPILSSAGVKRSLTGTAINPFEIVYWLVSLKFCLSVCKSAQPRSWIRDVTLDLRW